MEDVTRWNEGNLLDLIKNEVQENIQLDYKACASLDNTDSKKKEISKDVSALANSAGGILIYGIIEKGHIPIKLDAGFDPIITTKEWLEQVINSRIQRKINNVIIQSIDIVSSGSDRVVYVVSVPQSHRAPHQAHDKRFYKRYNFQSVPMEEYEIRDVSHRNDGPRLSLNFECEGAEVIKNGEEGNISNSRRRIKISPLIFNESVVPAEYLAVRMYLDKRIVNVSNLGDFQKQKDAVLTVNECEIPCLNLALLHSIPSKMPIFKGSVFGLLNSPLQLDVENDGDYFISFSIICPYMDEAVGAFYLRVHGVEVDILKTT